MKSAALLEGDEHATTDVYVCLADGSVVRECPGQKQNPSQPLEAVTCVAICQSVLWLHVCNHLLAVAQCHALQQALGACAAAASDEGQ